MCNQCYVFLNRNILIFVLFCILFVINSFIYIKDYSNIKHMKQTVTTIEKDNKDIKKQQIYEAFILLNDNDKLKDDEINDIINSLWYAEEITGIDALLLLCLAHKESNFSIKAKSKKGYKSILQTPIASQKWYSVDILLGAEILKEKLKYSNGDIYEAITRYKGGINKPVAKQQAKIVIQNYNYIKNKIST